MVSEFGREMIRFQKSSFDNGFTMLDMVQDLAEIWFSTLMDQGNWLPEEGRQFTRDWISIQRRSRKAFKRMVDGVYDSFLAVYPKTAAGTPTNVPTAKYPNLKIIQGGYHDDSEPNHQTNHGFQQERF